MQKLLGYAALVLVIGCSGSDDPAGAGDAGASGGSAGGGAGGTSGADAGGASGTGASGGDAGPGSDAKPAPSQTAKQVSRNGFTWTFDGEYQVGQYVNGDYWVIDPGSGVGITSVTPAPTGSASTRRNGSMINPVDGEQGYDGRVSKFADGVSVNFPATLASGQSLVSMESRGSGTDGNCPADKMEDISGYCVASGHGFLLRASALTAVSDVPPADAFRPPFSGSKKTSHYAGNLNRSLLPKLALATRPAASVVAESATHFEHPWVDHRSGWTGRAMHPIKNMPNYGREIGKIVSRGAVLLTLDYTDAELEPLLINYVQLGIDLQAMSDSGTSWYADGGHGNARKWPVLFAGIMLGDETMKNSSVVTGEDGQTYYGTVASKNAGQATIALFGADCTSSYQANGCSGSGSKDCRDPAGAIDACSDYRGCCTSHTWVGEALAARIMGGAPLWKNDAFFSYVDRWMGYGADQQVDGGGGSTDPFIGEAWKAHRASYP